MRTLIGTMPCLCCGVVIPVKENDGGTINVSCPYCDLSVYAKAHTQACKQLRARIAPAGAPAPAAAAAPAPAAPAPEKKSRGIWP